MTRKNRPLLLDTFWFVDPGALHLKKGSAGRKTTRDCESQLGIENMEIFGNNVRFFGVAKLAKSGVSPQMGKIAFQLSWPCSFPKMFDSSDRAKNSIQDVCSAFLKIGFYKFTQISKWVPVHIPSVATSRKTPFLKHIFILPYSPENSVKID